jgi:hypothetical protein
MHPWKFKRKMRKPVSMELLKRLYGDEEMSKCCKARLIVEHTPEGTSYYVCTACGRPSTLVPLGDDFKGL